MEDAHEVEGRLVCREAADLQRPDHPLSAEESSSSHNALHQSVLVMLTENRAGRSKVPLGSLVRLGNAE